MTRRLPGTALERLEAEHDVKVWAERLPPSADELRDGAREAEGLLCLLTDRIDAELLGSCPRLRAISNYAAGTDNVDLAAAAARGIAVGVTPDVLTETTADLAFGLLLGAARRLVEADAEVRRGDWLTWEPGRLLGRDVHGATLGIVGRGRIGSAVARRAAGFAMEIVQTDSTSSREELDELLARADFVTIHCPLTPKTRGLIGARELSLMKPTSILVNTARGPIVETNALAAALRDRRIAGAGLDVTDPEPLPPDHPLLGAPGLTVVPHVGSATHSARQAMADLAVDNLVAALTGAKMPSPATPP